MPTRPSTWAGLHHRRGQGGDSDSGLDSFLVGWSTDTEVTGLDGVPAGERRPATPASLSFDAIVGIGTALSRSEPRRLGLVETPDIPRTPWFLRAVAVSGAGAVLALWCG